MSATSSKDEPKEFTDVVKPAPKNSNTSSSSSSSPDNKDEGAVSTNQGFISNQQIAETLRNSPTFNKFKQDINDAQIAEIRRLAPLQEYVIEVDGQMKSYQKKKIRRKDYKELEVLRAKLSRSRDPIEISELNDTILEKAAYYYLGMTPEEFDAADYETVKRILDTCNIVTVHGVPANPN